MGTTFQKYRPLDETRKEIRILTLHSARNGKDSPIECTMETTPLADAGDFAALSYTWGSVQPQRLIMLDGQEMAVRKNLHDFLSELRARLGVPGSSDSACRLWADYICISQGDFGERTYQVHIMGQIFAAATVVLSWLGYPPEDGYALSNFEQDLEQDLADFARLRPAVLESSSRRRSRFFDYSDPRRARRVPSVATSPYWTRLWIKQEVLLPRKVWFCYGCEIVDCGRLWKSLRKYQQANPEYGREDPLYPMLTLLAFTTERSDRLHELVDAFHEAKCEDPRDRIYALLALVDPSTRDAIQAEYEKPLLQVLLDNFTHWTGLTLPAINPRRGMDTVPLYDWRSFPSCMAKLFSAQELARLFATPHERHAIGARAAFTTTRLSYVTLVSLIAFITDKEVCPILVREDARTDNPGHGFVVSVTYQATRDQSPNLSTLIVYADSVPRIGDLMTRIGPTIFFLRSEMILENSFQSHGDLVVSATGSDDAESRRGWFVDSLEHRPINGVCHREGLSDEDLAYCRLLREVTFDAHPCDWKRQQLHDATYEVVPRSEKADSLAGVVIVHNSTAITLHLAKSKEYWQFVYGPTASQTHGGWNPYEFGTQHGILQPCSVCLTHEVRPPHWQWSSTNCKQHLDCTCIWSSAAEDRLQS